MAKFRTSARSVDMLGRQQIAGVPTAVSEIFKNAYDAYAKSVRGDYFPARRVLTIRDDGVGMSRQDFETRWLTVGTDSKATGSTLPKIHRPADVAERRQMGEKGIGRLAIASLAPQLIVVSLARPNGAEADGGVVVALIQWTLFEAPGLTLDDVSVPIREFANIDEVTPEAVMLMRAEFTSALAALGDAVAGPHRDRILAELEQLDTDILRYLRLNGPHPGFDHGTAFVLSAVHDDVEAAMSLSDTQVNDFAVSEFQRFMLGFTNTITGRNAPAFDTQFVRHGPTGPVDVISRASYFWGVEDFDQTDHVIEGQFDEFGTFRGTASIYRRDAVEVVETWAAGKGNRSSCGPFRIKFGYVQGQASDSRLPADEFTRMTNRLGEIGGLYIYRDGVRVLPYGNSDYDYLQVEQRRSLNAATYFFSYRRMFGAIEIDSTANPLLQEKAGREGFRENRAYRDFKDILKGFLVQLAADLFSNKADTADEWRTERDRLKRRAEARASRERAEQVAREKFVRLLHERITFIESGEFGKAATAIADGIKTRLAEATEDGPDVVELERWAGHQFDSIRNRLDVARPLDLPLSREEERDLHSFERLKIFAEDRLNGVAADIENLLRQAWDAAAEKADHRLELGRRRDRMSAVVADSRERVEALAAAVRTRAATVGGRLAHDADASLRGFDLVATQLLDDVERAGFASEMQLAAEVRSAAESHAAVLEQLLQHAQTLLDAEGTQTENVQLKEEVLDLREQLDNNLELMQLGQAVQIVSHEFEASIRSVRSGLQALQPWARSTPKLQPIVRDVRASFAHLDGYLRLFTPLQRRLYREAVTVSGDEIEAFLRNVFVDRLERHDVRMVATQAFRKWSLTGYPSTFYPVFVNLVDNAIHWVASEPGGERLITLDADQSGASIRDTGPGVRPRDLDAIFERGFSRRRGGRGLGLPLARELLQRDGWDLGVVVHEVGAEFRMSRGEGADA